VPSALTGCCVSAQALSDFKEQKRELKRDGKAAKDNNQADDLRPSDDTGESSAAGLVWI
jgi:hypothetical protein